MAKTRSVGIVLALTFAVLPVFAQAESPAVGQPSASVQEDATVAVPKPVSVPMGRVTRASFTSEIVAREPQDSITSLSNENVQILFFTELHGTQGQTIFHVWEREGTEMARVAFEVGGPRWRVYSTKNLVPSWLGQWIVRVEDGNGRELDRAGFSYVSTAASGRKDMRDASQELPLASESDVTLIQHPPAKIR